MHLIFTLIPFILFLLGYTTTYFSFHQRVVSVPCLIGKSSHEAIKKASASSLNIQFFREKLRDDVAEGVVLEQFPKSGLSARIESKIFVTVAVHRAFGDVPDLVGKKYSDVLNILKKVQVKPEVFWLESVYPKSFCISQFPSQGTNLRNGEVVAYFSSGKNNLAIFPNLKGRPIDEVKAFFEKEKMKLEVFSKSKNAGKLVLDQKPVAGSIIDCGRQVYVQVQV